MKFLGVYFFFQGATNLFNCADFLLGLLTESYGISMPISVGIVQMLPSLACMSAGLYLFYRGRWIVDRAIPGNRNYCHECGYDLSGNLHGICSEFGTAFRVPEAMEAPGSNDPRFNRE